MKQYLRFAALAFTCATYSFIAAIGLGTTVQAQEDRPRVCALWVENAGDPILNGYEGPPLHYYFSETFNAATGASDQIFLKWVVKTYSRTWKGYNGYSQSYGEQISCSNMTVNQFNAAVAAMRKRPNTVVTLTAWPAAD